MTPMLDDDLIAAQHEVQRRLGDCLLQLQDYELRLKRLLAVSDIRHTSSGHGQITCDTSADLHRKTLGMLAGELMGSFFMVEGESFDGTKLEDAEPSGPTITFRARIALSKEDFQQTEIDIRDLVTLRNDLVHHFLEGQDLKTLEGCLTAQAALTRALDRVAAALAVLSSFEGDLSVVQGEMAAHISTSEGQEFFVQSRLPWHRLQITQTLTEAAKACTIDGWASVSDAVTWMAARIQDEDPGTYGCKSWSQVIHETRLFDLRYLTRDGKRQLFYRIRGRGPGQAP